jgi:formate dehydrogenase beta subunit
MNLPVIDTVQGKQSSRTKKSSVDHSLMPPCQAACPLHMDIREYVDLVAQGKIMEALQVIRDDNPFPSICAYVCDHPCEEACRRGQVDKPVAIRALKRFAVEFGGDRMIQTKAETTHSERVAIVGSGPAGLSAAYYLRKLGYPVAVFEADTEPGGMLRVGIPEYRLPPKVINDEIQRLIQMGVEIRLNSRVVSLDLLFGMDYKAIFVAIGAHRGRKLRIPGAELDGTWTAVSFLRHVRLGQKVDVEGRVVVLGGGNVAFDCARTARRLGAKEVHVACLEPWEGMLADAVEIEQAQEEGIVIHPSRTFTQILEQEGHVAGVECLNLRSMEFDKEGKLHLDIIEGSEHSLAADMAIFAIGQGPDLELFSGLSGIEVTKQGTIVVDHDMLTTRHPGVFAGGDVVTGTASATQALATGREVAFRIDEYLQHKYPRAGREAEASQMGDLLPETIEMIKKTERLEPSILSTGERVKSFEPVELVYDWEAAVNQARRCLRCGMGAEILFQDKCATCLTCLRVCPYHVPYLDDSGTIQIPADQCQACGICVAECPAKAIVLRKPYDRRHITEELDHHLRSAAQSKSKPLIIGFCCQYGLFGTGALAGLWRGAKAGIWIVPVLCVAKVEAEHILRAFEMGAEGVFIAGCGEQCARENTASWVRQRVDKVRKTLTQLGLEPERLQTFNLSDTDEDPVEALDKFTEKIGGLYFASVIMQEVKK